MCWPAGAGKPGWQRARNERKLSTPSLQSARSPVHQFGSVFLAPSLEIPIGVIPIERRFGASRETAFPLVRFCFLLSGNRTPETGSRKPLLDQR